MTLADRNRAKQRCFRHLLEGGIAALHFDARHPGVQVPPRFANDPWLVLNFSWRYNVADFLFDDEHVQGSLSFSGRPYFCVIPWTAVFAMTNEARTEGQHWADDMPQEPPPPPPEKDDVPLPPRSLSNLPERPATVTPVRKMPARRPTTAQPDAEDALPETSNEPPPRLGLQVITGGRTQTEDDTTPEPPPQPPRGTGHLRRVK